MLHRYTPVLRAVLQFGAGLAICRLAANAGAQEEHHHKDMAGMAMGDRAKTANGAKPVFVASTAKSFATLMDDAMAVMDDGMRQTPVNSRSVHDFITMMMPRHHGAVDMATAVLQQRPDNSQSPSRHHRRAVKQRFRHLRHAPHNWLLPDAGVMLVAPEQRLPLLAQDVDWPVGKCSANHVSCINQALVCVPHTA